MERWRLLDTGLSSATRHIAISRALLEARRADEIPGTLRFLRLAPCALLGCRQRVADELDAARCAAEGLAVQRRITTGAMWLADERQLGWELHLHRREVGRADMQTLGRRVAHAAATAVTALGVDARCRSAHDIEIDGRTVGVLGGAVEGEALLFQGLIYTAFDPARLVRLARMPLTHAGERAAAEARMRICGLGDVLRRVDAATVRRNLAEAFESAFDMELADGELTLSEHARVEAARREIDTADWVALAPVDYPAMPMQEATHAFAGGRLRAVIKCDPAVRTLRDVWFSGDVGLAPQRLLPDLEAALRDTPVDMLARRVEWFFGSRPVAPTRAQPGDFISALRLAVGRPLTASSR